MSGRSCSAACAVFFDGDPPSIEEPPKRGDADADPLLAESSPQLHQRDVRRFLDEAEDQIGVGFDVSGSPIPALETGRHVAHSSP